MAEIKKSLSFIQVGEKYRLAKATNTVDFRMGELMTKRQLQEIIASGVAVTITNNK